MTTPFPLSSSTLTSLSRLYAHNHTPVDYLEYHNSTNNYSVILPKRDEELVKIEIAIQAVILALAVFGNSIVLLVLCIRRKKLSRMNLLIVHLSLADLFVAFFNILPQLIWDITFRFQGNDILCRLVKFFQVVAMYASSYVLVTTAIDRYLAICHPLTSHTWSQSKVHVMAGVAWGLSLGFSIPQIVIFSYREVLPGVSDCWGYFFAPWTVKLYVTWFFLAVYLIPSCILVFTYGRICFIVWGSVMSKEATIRDKNMKQRSFYHSSSFDKSKSNKLIRHSFHNGELENHVKKPENPRAHGRSVSRAKLKTVKLTLTVIACYLVCWSPFFIAQMWGAWDPNAPLQASSMVVMMLLASLNSCTNPWIYLAFSDNICASFSRRLSLGQRRYVRASSTFDSETRTKMSTILESSVRFDRDRSVALRDIGGKL